MGGWVSVRRGGGAPACSQPARSIEACFAFLSLVREIFSTFSSRFLLAIEPSWQKGIQKGLAESSVPLSLSRG